MDGAGGMMTHHHGSTTRIDGAYRPLTHFGTRAAALARALHQAHKAGLDAIWLQEVRLDVRHPFTMTDIGQHSVIRMIDHLHYDHRPRRDRLPTSARDRVFAAMPDGCEVETFAAVTREHGFDGYGYVNVHEDPGSTSIIILESDQAAAVGPPVRIGFDEGYAMVLAARAAA
jgi:hypothetical protein